MGLLCLPTFPERHRDTEELPRTQRCSELNDLPGISLDIRFEKPRPADSSTKSMEMASPFHQCPKLAGPLGSASEGSWCPLSVHLPRKGQQRSLGAGKPAFTWLRYQPKLAAALSLFNFSRCSGGSGEAPGAGGRGCARTTSVPLKRVRSYVQLFFWNYFWPCLAAACQSKSQQMGGPGSRHPRLWMRGVFLPSGGNLSPVLALYFWQQLPGTALAPTTPDFLAVLPPVVTLPCHT